MIRISQLPWRLLTLLVMTLAVAACAGFDPGELIPPLSVGTPTAPAEPTPTATVASSLDATPILMCTPPVSYTHLDVYKRQPLWLTKSGSVAKSIGAPWPSMP